MATFYLILVLSIVWLSGSSWADDNKIICPKYCNCDLYENLNRADCSDKKLISTSIDIPSAVEILDLSYNDINTLEDKCFKELVFLQNLTISNNGVHTIFLDAFYDLVNLQHIDLSYNRLESFDPRIFENNLKLVGVNLNGNKFMSLSNEPFIISPSIQYLSLHESQIVQLADEHFIKIPLLTTLDLSDNLMVTLTVAPFMRMTYLKYLNILNNRWTTCHNDLKSTVEYLRTRHVEVRTNVCNTKFGENKFERMMMAPTEEAITEPAIEKDISSIWKNSTIMNRVNSIKCVEENLESICSLYESCSLMYNRLLADQVNHQYRLKFLDQNQRMYVALYSGIFLGFFVTSSVIYVVYLIYGSRYWKKRRLQQKLAERRRHMGPLQPCSGQPVAIPRPLRATRTSQRPPQSQPTRHAINRAYQREFLLARLFERPERHRYNHHPHHHNHQTNLGGSTISAIQNLDTERLIQPSPNDDQNTSPIATAVQNNNATEIQIEPVSQEQNIQDVPFDIPTITVSIPSQEEPPTEPVRPETPPPPYSEIVRD